MTSRPRKDDPSVPREKGYAYKKRFYRSADVASDYDAHRLGTPLRRSRYRRQWALIRRILADLQGVRRVLDLPCGTGRYTGPLAESGYRVAGADISREMMEMARRKRPPGDGVLGYLQADAERLPLADGAVDCVVSIRFTFHLDSPARVRVLREMKRVSSRWVLLDYRHLYTLRYLRRVTAQRLGLDDRPFERVSRRGLAQEVRAAGLRVHRVVRGGFPGFSDKWLVVAESDEPPPSASLLAGTEFDDVEVLGPLGEGARARVFAARRRGRDVVLKVYKPGAIERHARRHPKPLATFEQERNARFHGAPGLAPFVAEPLGHVVTDRGQVFLQERVDGPLYSEVWEAGGKAATAGLFEQIERIVARAHAAGLFEIDVHPKNVRVVEGERGELRPVLFDFNTVPIHARRRNPVGFLQRTGLLSRRWRDRRHLRRFHGPLAGEEEPPLWW